jgi:hypothetical protein
MYSIYEKADTFSPTWNERYAIEGHLKAVPFNVNNHYIATVKYVKQE